MKVYLISEMVTKCCSHFFSIILLLSTDGLLGSSSVFFIIIDPTKIESICKLIHLIYFVLWRESVLSNTLGLYRKYFLNIKRKFISRTCFGTHRTYRILQFHGVDTSSYLLSLFILCLIYGPHFSIRLNKKFHETIGGKGINAI